MIYKNTLPFLNITNRKPMNNYIHISNKSIYNSDVEYCVMYVLKKYIEFI